ncbi:MAG: dephospho-CoA kinase, partial [Chitinophagaceae bacterium]
SGSSADLDYVIGVTAPEALRIKRVMQRDGVTRDEVLKRMRNQIEDAIKMRLCDFVIQNDEQSLVVPKLIALHEQILSLAKTHPTA